MAVIDRMINNRLLGALTPEDFRRLADDLQPVSLPKRQVLYAVGAPLDHVFFIERGLASVLTMMEDGTSSEVGMVGPEGLIGASALLGGEASAQHVVMQLPGEAFRLPASVCRAAFDRSTAMRAVVLRFVEDLLNLSAQTAACNRLHSVEQRCARWLLMASDRVQSNVLGLTQEFLAFMIGVRRSGVSVAASDLQRAGLIRYRRGEITIIDRDGLEDLACECYRLDHRRVGTL